MFENSDAASASKVLKELLGDRKFSKEQQMRVLEHRREILTRCMKNFSQKTLGQLACMDSGDGIYHELRRDSPRVVSLDNKFRLDTRGCFAGNMFFKKKGWERITFGIDDESWLLIKITFITDNSLGAYEEALHVEVARTDLLMILDEVGLQPFHVWVYFNSIIDEWVSDRKNLYDQACKVAQGMDEENALFRMVS